MRWGLLVLALAMLALTMGCGDDDGVEPDAGMDVGPDVGEVDTGTDAPGTDAPVSDDAGDDAGEVDAAEMDAGGDSGPMAVCGWSDDEGSYACSASDMAPDIVVCVGDECCTPTPCSPDDAQVCCNMVTGQLRTIFYSGGTCEELIESCVE